MMKMLLKLILNIVLRPQKGSDLALENLALRQQLAILKRSKKRPQIRTKDRLFWVLLSRFWSSWQEPLIVVKRLTNMGIKEVITAARSPWQNPFVERLIGSIRRDCLDHAIVLNESHLKRILISYFQYYHALRSWGRATLNA